MHCKEQNMFSYWNRPDNILEISKTFIGAWWGKRPKCVASHWKSLHESKGFRDPGVQAWLALERRSLLLPGLSPGSGSAHETPQGSWGLHTENTTEHTHCIVSQRHGLTHLKHRLYSLPPTAHQLTLHTGQAGGSTAEVLNSLLGLCSWICGLLQLRLKQVKASHQSKVKVLH